MRVPIGGGAPTAVTATGAPWAVALDACNVYWTDALTPGAPTDAGAHQGSVWKLPKSAVGK